MKKFARYLSVACIAAAPLWFASSASAQFAKPEDAVKYRESAMTLMSAHLGRIAPVVRGQKPFDAADVQANANMVAMMAKLPWQAFGPGTEGGKALPDVWKDTAKFKQDADSLQSAVAKLVAAAQSGDQGQLRTAFGDVGQSCKACHDSFRKK